MGIVHGLSNSGGLFPEERHHSHYTKLLHYMTCNEKAEPRPSSEITFVLLLVYWLLGSRYGRGGREPVSDITKCVFRFNDASNMFSTVTNLCGKD